PQGCGVPDVACKPAATKRRGVSTEPA
ncbi:transcriptional regulator, partial [Pseudomonas sp. GW460-13]